MTQQRQYGKKDKNLLNYTTINNEYEIYRIIMAVLHPFCVILTELSSAMMFLHPP
jgi:hypothetical protein